MKTVKPINAILFTAIFSLIIGSLFQFNVYATFTVLFIMALFMKPAENALFMAVQKEIWENDIIVNLFKNNDFAKRAYNADQFVIGGKIVHIPVAGAPDASQKNVTVFPINAVKRADDEVLYPLDTFYQIPKFVEKVEQYELSYDKRQSIMGEQQSQLIQDCMEGLLYRWSLQGKNMDTPINYVLTTGAATATDVLTGAAGSRKTFDKTVFGAIKKAFDNANISPTGRVALLTANHYQQFIDSLSDAAQTNFYRFADMQKGVIGQFLGFDVLMRSSVQRWRRTAGVWASVDIQAAGFAPGADDSAASLFYYDQYVERARGDVNVFDSANRPEYYGDVFSMNMRLGGRVRKAVGVTAVVEDIV